MTIDIENVLSQTKPDQEMISNSYTSRTKKSF